ncbi:MAG TPA: hypothetical protein PLZ84_00320 [Clostridia bacterium]|nr:hypothetical protein [Clostridia bacterium]
MVLERLKNMVKNLKKKHIDIISTALAVIIFLTYYLVFINPFSDGLEGMAIQEPAEEGMLHYGDKIQIKSEQFNNFVSATGQSSGSIVNMQVNSNATEHWIILKKGNLNSNEAVKFGDIVFFQSAAVTDGYYLSSAETGREPRLN